MIDNLEKKIEITAEWIVEQSDYPIKEVELLLKKIWGKLLVGMIIFYVDSIFFHLINTGTTNIIMWMVLQ